MGWDAGEPKIEEWKQQEKAICLKLTEEIETIAREKFKDYLEFPETKI